MKIKVLVDNNTFIDEYYLAEPAVSYYIEDEGFKLLLDVGYSDVFLKNALKMNIDLNALDALVLTHGHNDHTGGLKYLHLNKKLKLISHPDTFNPKYDDNGLEIGADLSIDDLKENYDLNLTKEPYQISSNLYYLGEIKESIEKRRAIGTSLKEPDYCLDDSAIVYKGSQGLFIITSCSHSGIANIIETAKKLCNDERIYGILGGFHLFENDERLKLTIDYLKRQNIQLLYPAHCVSLIAKIEMAKQLKIHEVGVGLEINY